MQSSIFMSHIPLDTSVAIDTNQAERRRHSRSRRYQLSNEHTRLIFQGDGTYGNVIGEYMPDVMRPWGYVFWDADSLEKDGGRYLLHSRWTECWDEDPRDGPYQGAQEGSALTAAGQRSPFSKTT